MDSRVTFVHCVMTVFLLSLQLMCFPPLCYISENTLNISANVSTVGKTWRQNELSIRSCDCHCLLLKVEALWPHLSSSARI